MRTIFFCFAAIVLFSCGNRDGRPEVDQLSKFLLDTAYTLRYEFTVDTASRNVYLFASAERMEPRDYVQYPGYTYLDGKLITLQNNIAQLPRDTLFPEVQHRLRVLFAESEAFDMQSERPMDDVLDSVEIPFNVTYLAAVKNEIRNDTLELTLNHDLPGVVCWLTVFWKDHPDSLARHTEMHVPATGGRARFPMKDIPYRKSHLALDLWCRQELPVLFYGKQKGVLGTGSKTYLNLDPPRK